MSFDEIFDFTAGGVYFHFLYYNSARFLNEIPDFERVSVPHAKPDVGKNNYQVQ